VPGYGHIAGPLTNLLGNSTAWHRSFEHQEAFETVQEALCSSPVLAYPDFKKPFVVGTDASDFAVGATFQQTSGRGLQPVAFLSHKLSQAEQKYPTHVKELLAVIQALKQYGHDV
jgi:hypothetical protein